MTNEILTAMSKRDQVINAQQTYSKARKLYEASLLLVAEENNGVANSLLILATEECIKGMILTAVFLNVNLKFKVKPYFNDHATRHPEAAEMQEFINTFAPLNELLSEVLRQRKSRITILISLGLSLLLSSIQLNEKESEDLTAWWQQANEMKMNGLYVDYDTSNHLWKRPQQITSEIFENTKRIATPFLETLNPIVEFKEEDYKLLDTDSPFLTEGQNPSGDINLSEYKLKE